MSKMTREDREAIIRRLECLYREAEGNSDKEALFYGIEALKEQRPHGKWIIVDDCEHFMAKCSVCGRIEDSRLVKYYPFCRCGADMRKEGEAK